MVEYHLLAIGEKSESEISLDSIMALDLMISQNNSKNEIIIAPKKIHLATSGGIEASALILELPITSNDTINHIELDINIDFAIVYYLPAVYKSAT